MRFVALLLPFAAFAGPSAAEISVRSDFPGGSGAVESIDQRTATIVLNPTDHPGRGWRCWWYVRVTGLTPGKPFTLNVGEAPWATPKRATYSIDGGETWRHSREGKPEGKRMTYVLTPDTAEIQVAWGPPFVPGDGRALVDRIAKACPDATSFSLCQTRENRDTPALRFSGGNENLPLVWIQARQHAWESGASWVGKGFAEWLASDAPMAEKLRRSAEIVFIPIMDIDNVHRGAGGKNQKPQDHNRDWSDAPHWHAVAAAQREIRAAAETGRLAAFVDLHNPGAGDLFPYFYVPPPDILCDPAKENLTRFLASARKHMTGPLRFTGKTIVSDQTYDSKAWRQISKNWVAQLGTPAVAATLETAWNTPASTTDGYETVGRQLGEALESYLAN